MVVSGVGGLDVYLKIHILFDVGFYGYFININLVENMVFNLKTIVAWIRAKNFKKLLLFNKNM